MSMLDSVPNTGPLNPGNSAVLKIVVESLSDPETVLQEFTSEGSPDQADVDPAATVAPLPVPAPAPAAASTFIGF